MRWDLGNQWLAFANSFWQGAVFAVVFDCFRMMRIPFRWKMIEVAIQDLVYWNFISFWAFVFLLQNSDGVLRWYILLGWIVGWVLWYETMGKLLLLITKKIYVLLCNQREKIRGWFQKQWAKRQKQKACQKIHQHSIKKQKAEKSKKKHKKSPKKSAKDLQNQDKVLYNEHGL